MAGEEAEGDFSPAKPDQAVSSQVGEGSVRSAVPARTPSWYEQELPYEALVSIIRRLVEEARARHRQGHPDGPFSPNEPFEPAEWLGWYLHQEASKDNDLREGHHPRYDLVNAWDALYYTRYPAEGGQWSHYTRSLLETHVEMTQQTSLTLPPKSVTLLDAMAEAAGLPRKRGEATIDLTPFVRPSVTPRLEPRENKSIIRHPTK